MIEDNIVGLHGGLVELGEDRALTDAFSAELQKLRADGAKPTAALWVVMADDGRFRFGWSAEQSALPPSAVVGIAVAAIMKIGQCGHE